MLYHSAPADKRFNRNSRTILELKLSDLDAQITRLQVLNRSEANLANAIRSMFDQSGSRPPTVWRL